MIPVNIIKVIIKRSKGLPDERLDPRRSHSGGNFQEVGGVKLPGKRASFAETLRLNGAPATDSGSIFRPK